MTTYVFLSPEWVEAARRIRDDHAADLPAPPVAVRMNVIVTEAPFDDPTLRAHVDTSGGEMVLDMGHLDDVTLTVTVDYATARRIFVDQDQAAAMEAFMTGRIVVDGDLTQMLALQGQQIHPSAVVVAEKISEITAR
ncbi:MAG: hypothetical protein ACXIVQ_00415 [Acidimicrobiales bacterium]